ncbi:hypothetical protein N3K66_004162 [Trichothecium roseum]|uniref:Uncharacterized protein n=1 Tax=Trichothecium roseum TaxID=47278 RepID=A0ACC0V1W1_9HYPO|nr:hypothetical protein N3K66_004162 [Trichothecium roseum]
MTAKRSSRSSVNNSETQSTSSSIVTSSSDRPSSPNGASPGNHSIRAALGEAIGSNVHIGNTILVRPSRKCHCLETLTLVDPKNDKKRIEKTKGGLLRDCYCWVLENGKYERWLAGESPRLWISGDAGKGKTMLLCGIITELEASLHPTRQALAYFFCEAADNQRNSATAVLRGLIGSLVTSSGLDHDSWPEIHEQHKKSRGLYHQDVNAWHILEHILDNVLQTLQLSRITEVILVVDALDECVIDKTHLWNLICRPSSTKIKWVVSSRNHAGIADQLRQAGAVELNLESRSASSFVAAAVRNYISYKGTKLLSHLPEPRKKKLLYFMQSNASGTFLWVSLLFKAHLEGRIIGWNHVNGVVDLPPELDAYYQRMIENIDDRCVEVINVMLFVCRPTGVPRMTMLCNPAYSMTDLVRPDPDPLESFRYACVYWTEHLSKAQIAVHERGVVAAIGEFLRRRSLNWIEALSLTKEISAGITTLRTLHHLLEALRPGSEVAILAQDLHRLLWSHRCVLEEHPLQVYSSALLFSALRQTTRAELSRQKSDWMLTDSVVKYEWEPCLQTIEGHGSCINTVASSTDGLLLASGSCDKTVRIWREGELLNSFEHSDDVLCICFSPDVRYIATGSRGKMLKIWDLEQKTVSQPPEHGSRVTSTSISRDGMRLVTGSTDKAVKVWDASTAECFRTLQGHTDSITAVAFSADGRLVASGSYDSTARIWDLGADNGSCKTTKSTCGHITALGFSNSGGSLAFGLNNGTIAIWDLSSEVFHFPDKSHGDAVTSVAFSICGAQVVSSSRDGTVKIWNLCNLGKYALQKTLNLGRDVQSVRFDQGSPRLLTDSSIVCIEPESVSSPGQAQNMFKVTEFHEAYGYSISLDKRWVTLNGHNLMSLPFNYRPSCMATAGGIMFIGCESGQAFTIRFLSEIFPQYV